MSRLTNTVTLIGNTGREVEFKEFDNGIMNAKVSLATSETYKDSDGNKMTKTQWHNLVVWGERAKLFKKYVAKGNKLAVEGKLTYSTYTNDKGITYYNTEIEVRDFQFLTFKK